MGRKIRTIRTSKGLTLDQLSKLSGVSKSRLSDLENGLGSPTIATLQKIAKALRVSIEDLLD